MNFRRGIFWLAAFATLAGVIAVFLSWPHPSAPGLHQDSQIHARALGIMFFYAWGGVMACGSPLLYIWLWYRTRGTSMKDSEGL